MPRAHTGSRGGPTGCWRRSRAISSIASCYGEPRQGEPTHSFSGGNYTNCYKSAYISTPAL
eukprot:scaffold72865_cov28-Phaeocystis_antarctica.AAC.1